jgi:hypothetical protein
MSFNERIDIQDLRTNVLRRINQRRFVEEEEEEVCNLPYTFITSLMTSHLCNGSIVNVPKTGYEVLFIILKLWICRNK